MIGYSMLQRNALKRFVMVPLLVVGGIYLFVNVGFLGEKVISKMSFTSQTYNTRFKSAQLDLDAFISSPVVGVGRSDTMRFQDSEDNRQRHRNNGVTDFLAVYGLPLFLMYFAWMYRGFYSYCRVHQFNQYYSWMALGAVFLIGFSEIYFTKVFFIALTMLPMIYGQELFQGKEEHR
jgi:O-antigen ligase